LPPPDGPYPTIDSDPLIQLFPRYVWADSLHNAQLAASPVLKDLLERLQATAELPEAGLRERQRDETGTGPHDIDLIPLASWYESAARAKLMFTYPGDEDYDKTSYCIFWMLFRAASIRGQALLDGDDSAANKSALADDYIEMSDAMLEVEQQDDKFIVSGDLTLAEQCARSAYTLAIDNKLIRSIAEQRYREAMQLREAIAQNPDRIILRPRYGQFLARHLTLPHKLSCTYRPVQRGGDSHELASSKHTERGRRRAGGSTARGPSIPGTVKAAASRPAPSRQATHSTGPAPRRTARQNHREAVRAALSRSLGRPPRGSGPGWWQHCGSPAHQWPVMVSRGALRSARTSTVPRPGT
jgi:hypothetical protein